MTCPEQACGMRRALEISSRVGRQEHCISVSLHICILEYAGLLASHFQTLKSKCLLMAVQSKQHNVNTDLK